MNIKQRITLWLAAFIIVVISGCSSVDQESNSPMLEQDEAQVQESSMPSPSIKAKKQETNDRDSQKESIGSDDMERLD